MSTLFRPILRPSESVAGANHAYLLNDASDRMTDDAGNLIAIR